MTGLQRLASVPAFKDVQFEDTKTWLDPGEHQKPFTLAFMWEQYDCQYESIVLGVQRLETVWALCHCNSFSTTGEMMFIPDLR